MTQMLSISGRLYSACEMMVWVLAYAHNNHVLQSTTRASSANPATRVQRFAADILRYIYSNMKDGHQQTLESVIRYWFIKTPAAIPLSLESLLCRLQHYTVR